MNTDPTIRVRNGRVIYSLGVDEAEELAAILARYDSDTGWTKDSHALMEACDKIQEERDQ